MKVNGETTTGKEDFQGNILSEFNFSLFRTQTYQSKLLCYTEESKSHKLEMTLG